MLYVWVFLILCFVESLVTIPVSPVKRSGRPPLEGDVAITGNLWTGYTCQNLCEGFEEVLKTGFAVFECEDSMFRANSVSAPASVVGGGSPVESTKSPFNARWLKNAPPVDMTWATSKQTEPLAKFADHLHSILDVDARGVFTKANEDYVGVITVGGPFTRGSENSNPHVYSLHQDPCFYSSLKARNISAFHVYPFSAIAQLRKVLEKLDSRASMRNVKVRQVNFWLPHERSGDKCLVMLSRAASAALAARAVEDGSVGSNHEKGEEGVFVTNANGNRWLTAEGLRFLKLTLGPKHVFVVNKPVIFISANANDDTGVDAIFHCGAVLEGLGDCSTELRIAVCSKLLKETEVEAALSTEVLGALHSESATH